MYFSRDRVELRTWKRRKGTDGWSVPLLGIVLLSWSAPVLVPPNHPTQTSILILQNALQGPSAKYAGVHLASSRSMCACLGRTLTKRNTPSDTCQAHASKSCNFNFLSRQTERHRQVLGTQDSIVIENHWGKTSAMQTEGHNT